MQGCTETTATLSYPKHLLKPDDLLHFIESRRFSQKWDEAGLDLEDDLTSLQICIMANPSGDREVEGCGGLRTHRHTFGEWKKDHGDVIVYYAYFDDYGIAYLAYLDDEEVDQHFDQADKLAIRNSLTRVRREIERLRTLR